MVEIPRAERFGPGWWAWRHASQSGDERRNVDGACVTCPICGRGMALSFHTIAIDGTVSPSVVCPHEGCTWHVFIRLIGWPPA